MRLSNFDQLEARLCMASVSGYVYNDINANGLHDAGESALPATGITAYLDLNNNSQLDDGEPNQATSVRLGKFEFGNVAVGTYTVRLKLDGQMVQTDPADGGRTVTVLPTAAQSFVTVDPFGVYVKLPSYGQVYADANHDGVRASTESAIAGQTVYLDSNDNQKFDAGETSTVSTTSGFVFYLMPGTYHLRLNVKAGWVQSQPTSNGGYLIDTTAVTTQEIKQFGTNEAPVTGGITGIVWNDSNGDGVRQMTELPISGAAVYLDLNHNGAPDTANEPVAMTNGDGRYTFSGLATGPYTVREFVPSGWVQTYPESNGGYDVTVVAGQVVADKNFGRREVPTKGGIAGNVWNDANGNGIHDASETPANGAVIYLDLNNNAAFDPNTEPSATTGATGSYGFTGIAAGNYIVRMNVPANFVQTYPTGNNGYAVTVVAGQVTDDNNFGRREVPQTGRVNGVVWNDLNSDGIRQSTELGLGGQTVYIDANQNGSLNSGETTITTAASGEWSISLPGNHTYEFRVVVPAGITETAPAAKFYDVNVLPGTTTGDRNFGLHTNEVREGRIYGTYFYDANGNALRETTETGVSGGTVFLDTNNNSTLDAGEQTFTTTSAGAFGFGGLAAGTYHVRAIIPGGYHRTTPLADVVLAANQVIQNVLIGIQTNETTRVGSISGLAWADLNADGIRQSTEPIQPNKTIYIDANKNGVLDSGEKSTLTNSEGRYTFAGLPAGGYRIRRVVPTNFRLTMPAIGYYDITLAAGQNVVEKNFGTTERPLVSGRVFVDTNNDKQYNTGDLPLVGWTVYVDANKNGKFDDGEKSTLTTSGGEWVFKNLTAGNYRFRLWPKPGYKVTMPELGYYDITLVSGQIKTGVLFGAKPITTAV